MSASKYPPPGRVGSGPNGLSNARTRPAQPGSRPWVDREPGWTRARLGQLWMLKSALSEAGVPICTW